jgi:hypothetical protein
VRAASGPAAVLPEHVVLSSAPPFYSRVHGPVLWIESDHHPFVFLDDDEPKSFRLQTIIRTPNGGDDGLAHA